VKDPDAEQVHKHLWEPQLFASIGWAATSWVIECLPSAAPLILSDEKNIDNYVLL